MNEAYDSVWEKETCNNVWVNGNYFEANTVFRCGAKPVDGPIGSPEFNAAKLFEKEIKEADQKINKKVRNESWMDEKNIDSWRKTGLLDEVSPGSWEETTLAQMLENQRCIQEC